MTSVLNVIAVQSCLWQRKTVGGNYYKYFESYLVIAVIYFVLCFVFNRLFTFLEKKVKKNRELRTGSGIYGKSVRREK